MGKKGTLTHYWQECKLVQPLWKIEWRFLKTLKIRLPLDPVTTLLGIYPKKMKLGSQRDIWCSLQHYSIIQNSQDMETSWVSINGWMDKEDVRYTHTHANLEAIMLSKQVRQRITGAVRSHLQWKWKSLSRIQLFAIPWNSPGQNTGVGAFPFSRGSSQSRDLTQVSLIAGSFLTSFPWPQGKSQNTGVGNLSLLQWIFLTQESNWHLLHCR